MPDFTLVITGDSRPARRRLFASRLVAIWIVLGSSAALRAQTNSGGNFATSTSAIAETPCAPTAQSAIAAVESVGMTVSDLEKSVAFFVDVLTFEEVSETRASGAEFAALHGLPPTATARVARLRLGDEFVELAEYAAPGMAPRTFPADTRSNDRWFQHIAIIVSDLDKAHAWLQRQQVRGASRGPQRLPDWNPNAAGIKAYYFRDPDGHFLEILEFPPGKGDPRWQQMRGRRDEAGKERLFLGIDHTAIVVGDTATSLRFYRDILGFSVVGRSENFGPEQESLNNVSGARLRITTLRGASGPAIEFLEYLEPRDGRAYPLDARVTDLLHWHTTLRVHDADALASRLRAAQHRFVTEGVVALRSTSGVAAGAQRGFIVRDPDGHAMRLFGE